LRSQELGYLCKNTVINAGGNYGPHIFVFRGGKYWDFDNKPKPNKPFGELVRGQVPAKEHWPGLRLPTGVSDKDKDFVVVYKDKWSRWTPDGKKSGTDKDIEKEGSLAPNRDKKKPKKPGDPDEPDEEGSADTNERESKKKPQKGGKGGKGGKGKDKGNGGKGKGPKKKGDPDLPDEEGSADNDERDGTPDEEESAALERDPQKPLNKDEKIEDEEIPDEPDGDPADMGAIFNNDPNPDVRTHIKADNVCNLLFRENKLYQNGKCVNVDEDRHAYPPDLVAVVKNRDKDWYFVNNDGKYCKRKDKNYEKVCVMCVEWNGV
jgi:hypothetical protein